MSARSTYSLVIAVLLALASFVRLADPSPVSRMRLLAFDTMQQIAPRQPPANYPIRIVDIDVASMAEIGQWPWRRQVLARLVERLNALGARVIAFDFVFPVAERSFLDEIPAGMRGDPALDPAITALLQRLAAEQPGDQAFADAVRNKPVVLGVIGRVGDAAPGLAARSGFALLGSEPGRHVPSFSGATANFPLLQNAATGLGALNWFPEHDQIVRKVPMLVKVGDRLFPSLTAETMRLSEGAPSITVRSATAGGEAGFGGETGITSVRIGATQVPTDESGQVWLAFTRHDPGRFISARDVLNDTVARSEIEGRIILVGTSAPGLFDLRATPLDSALAGVEVHAQALEQMINAQALLRPDYSAGMEIVFTIVFCFLLAEFIRRSGAFAAALLGGATIAIALGTVWWAYRSHSVLLDPVFPAITLTGIYIFGTGFFFFQTERERNQIRQAFSHYMAPSLIERLTREPERLQLGGETRELTVLFSDVRGFTRIAEGYRDKPQLLIQLMNRLLTPLSNAIVERQGTIDKYMGDAIMAFWNAPLDDAAHPRNACLAALAMIKRLDRLNADRTAEAQATGEPFIPLQLGIGISTGPAMVGNMGSEMRFDYSALGDTVNLASRLEGLTAHYGTAILIGDSTQSQGAAGLAVIETDLVRVKGRDEVERIWTLAGDGQLAQSHAFQDFSSRFADALQLYRSQNWPLAAQHFHGLADAAAQLGFDRLVGCFLDRIESFKSAPPAADWDGSWTMDNK